MQTEKNHTGAALAFAVSQDKANFIVREIPLCGADFSMVGEFNIQDSIPLIAAAALFLIVYYTLIDPT